MIAQIYFIVKSKKTDKIACFFTIKLKNFEFLRLSFVD